MPVLLINRRRQGKAITRFREKFLGSVRIAPRTGTRLWLHAVSVGEVNLLVGLVREIEAQMPDVDVVISSTTKTGLELAEQRFGSDRVFAMPFDFSWAVRRVLKTVDANMLVLAELEVWPNLVRASVAQGTKVVVVNGRLSEKSFRGYQRGRWLLGGTFSRLSLIAAQDGDYASRFIAMGTPRDRVHVTGATKFDAAPTTRDTPEVRHARELLGSVSEPLQILLAGSTQEGEEEVVLRSYKELQRSHPNLRLISVPRHAERFEAVAATIVSAGFRVIRRSETDQCRLTWESDEIFLVDSIGELRTWWGVADVAFVGGSLGDRGGQNMLEPAGYGAAVCFGPNTRNFREIVARLLEVGGARVVADGAEMVDFVDEMVRFPDRAKRMGEAAQRMIAQHQGATRRTVGLLSESV